VVGTVDPLHDESWRLIQRLNGLNKDFYMIVYTHMPHGFLSFDTPQGWRACKVTVEDAANILQSMLQQSDYATQIDDYLNEKPSAA
jgi:hormone-sensitive lipase